MLGQYFFIYGLENESEKSKKMKKNHQKVPEKSLKSNWFYWVLMSYNRIELRKVLSQQQGSAIVIA